MYRINQTPTWDNSELFQYITKGNCPLKWEKFFEENLNEFVKISTFLRENKEKIIYPPIDKVFRALRVQPENIKVVILGQDPYHDGNAVGLCFSVSPLSGKINPSLRNIYLELKNEGYAIKENGVLTHWADQGCLMLNTALTVFKGLPESNIEIWKNFTEKLIKFVAENTTKIVWILMGAKAQKFANLIDKNNNQILMSSHPSPFSARKNVRTIPAFIGSNIFKEANKYLESSGKIPIKW